MEFITIFSLIAVFYAYFGYPLLLVLLTLVRRSLGRLSGGEKVYPESFTVLIAARNEEGVITEKLVNTFEAIEHLRNEMGIEAQVIVASDGSTDLTDQKVLEWSERGVVLSRLEPAGGKEKAQKKALEKATGEIVVFTDAKVKLAPDALVGFRRYFEDLAVGAVSSIDRVEGGGSSGSGEGFYVRYEMWLRKLESRFGSLVGLSGSCFAVRRRLTNELRVNVPSDFAMLLSTKQAGLRGVHGSDIICTYKAVKTEEEEFKRKVRTVLRGITTLYETIEVLNPFRYGSFAWQVFSHKLCRWLVPWFFMLQWVGSLLLFGANLSLTCLALLNVCFAVVVLAGLFFKSSRSFLLVKVPFFFVVSNAAVLVATVQFLQGKRSVAWTPSAKQK